jgi:hypothetical protein
MPAFGDDIKDDIAVSEGAGPFLGGEPFGAGS